jgi:3-dehydroquinate synthase
MIFKKKINNEKHIIHLIHLRELEKQLFKEISNLDVLIIDRSLISIRLLNKISKKFQDRTLILLGNEKIKSLNNYKNIIEKIIKMGIQRKSKIYSFGGGTIGDLSGFLASTLLRGIDHIMIPTSLLAMVDSSIGGKTGINSEYGKNLIGSFYLPKKVIICPDFINTLPKREVACGFAEVIKYSIIKPSSLNKILYNHEDNINFLSLIIENSIKTKLSYVSDFKEKSSLRSSRAVLNFGHTIGHAIENSNSYNNSIKHGEAIAIGIIIELKISQHLGYYKKSLDPIIKIIRNFGLPTDYSKYISKKNMKELINKMKFDKKVNDGNVSFICVDNKGGFVKNITFKNLEKILIQII